MAAIKAAVRSARKLAASRAAAGTEYVGAASVPPSPPLEWSASRWLADGDGRSGRSPRRAAAPAAPVAESVAEAIASALVAPLRTARPPGNLAVDYVRALASQPDRRLAVERLLRDGEVIEAIAQAVCEAADRLGEDGSPSEGY